MGYVYVKKLPSMNIAKQFYKSKLELTTTAEATTQFQCESCQPNDNASILKRLKWVGHWKQDYQLESL